MHITTDSDYVDFRLLYTRYKLIWTNSLVTTQWSWFQQQRKHIVTSLMNSIFVILVMSFDLLFLRIVISEAGRYTNVYINIDVYSNKEVNLAE